MRILVVGAGSTGGYFGGRLVEAGRDVTFLVRPRRAAQLERDGLLIVSPHGDLQLAPKVVTADAIAAPYDVVILAVKAFALESALADMAPAIGPGSMILPLLNGMRHIDAIRARFGDDVLIGGVCRCVTALDEVGRIIQSAPVQEFFYGEMDGRSSDRIRALDDTMREAGFDARLSDAIERDMWEKWVLLSALGAITCLMRGPIGAVASAPGGIQSANAILDEVIATISAAGVAPRESYAAAVRGELTNTASTMTSSMYRDMRAGNAVETDQILGDLVRRAESTGTGVPLLRAAHAQLSIYQASRPST